ncbi:2',3'-cyclic-nucleotide 2'-phosphodiesterase / 3'-nucleotidase / 5'-nucleotidase [Gracilibacillus ureilyticus]|uniref:2',3'-cyclic-nucleotide 2'-phosphodiesterase / 3'-nucleotidase / 5'-nucleotidase n=1 Tax=Gracilibacillus ureilyticus TaxID=531814 RepID=A0A1H9VMC6_9BACI|nr:5'-nucleotidase C-terminal domain-containing protein [Gracilibacillus ureilyticus]SES22701.1 2',3'-cyclic-nucleotide 2'-phosphodiesterase / 3'-nucleotidase / 5'-nucleotidase [Gracilibacillus ureilyticus]
MKKGTNPKAAAAVVAATAALVAAPAIQLADSIHFTDVAEDHPYYEVISDFSSKGIISGYGDGELKLNKSISRAEVSIILSKILELDSDNTALPFTDVEPDAWYTDSIKKLFSNDIIIGKNASIFAPETEVTRAEFAQMLLTAYDIPTEETTLPFTDLNSEAWYMPAVTALYANGLIKGIDENTFAPDQPLTRGDAVWLLANTHKQFSNIDEEEGFSLSIMHTNDIHSHLDDIPKLVTAVNEVRQEMPDALLLDAGDVNTGTLYFHEYKGQAELAFMNLMKYDAMTFGNHEFDQGSSNEGHKALYDFVTDANFPFVSSNINFSKNQYMGDLFSDISTDTPNDGEIYNSIVKEVNGEKIGIFGLTTEETVDISSPGDIEFENYLNAAEEAVQELEAQGADKIIALTHIGFDDNPAIDNDQQLAANIEGIDIIVGGHSHTELAEPVVVTSDAEDMEPTIIVQAYQYANFLGTLDVEFDENGVITGYAGDLIEIAEQEDDPEALALLATYSEKVEMVKNEESGGVAEAELPNPRISDDSDSSISVRNSETALGNLITDGMLSKAKEYNPDTSIAVQNSGGIRTFIDKGPITIGEILTVMPFGNTLALMELKGSELKEALEHSVSQTPNESGGFLQVSGMKFTYDSSAETGNKVGTVEVMQDGEYVELDENKTYIVATNAFAAKGGDGFDTFAKAYEEGRVTDLGLSDWENFRDYVAELGTVNPSIEGRIVDTANQ